MQDDYSSMPTRQLLDAKPVQDPYFCLWAGLMDMAATRVKSLLRFAREWNDIRFAPDYAVRRHRAVFHLNWVMSDEPSQRFTFRSLCQFAKAEDLQNVEMAR